MRRNFCFYLVMFMVLVFSSDCFAQEQRKIKLQLKTLLKIVFLHRAMVLLNVLAFFRRKKTQPFQIKVKILESR